MTRSSPPPTPQGGRENCKEKRRHAPEAADQLGAASCGQLGAASRVLAHIGDKWRAQPTKGHACGFRSENAKRSVENEYLYGETISESQYSQSIKNEFCEQGNWTKKNSIKLDKTEKTIKLQMEKRRSSAEKWKKVLFD